MRTLFKNKSYIRRCHGILSGKKYLYVICKLKESYPDVILSYGCC